MRARRTHLPQTHTIPAPQNNKKPQGIEDLRDKRDAIVRQIQEEEEEKAGIQHELGALTRRLAAVSESLSKKVKTWVLVVLGVRASTHAAAVARAPTSRTSSQPKTHNNALHPKPHHPHHPTSKPNQTNETIKVDTKAEYDKVIGETEAAYLKILESSQTLLTVLKRESVNIQKKRSAAA